MTDSIVPAGRDRVSTVVVSGDVTIDWNLARTRKLVDGGAVWNSEDRTETYGGSGGAAVLARLVEEVSGTLADEGLTVEVAGPCCRQGLTSPCDPKLPPLRRRLVSVRAHRLAGSIEASRPRSKRPSVRTGLNGLR